MASVKQLTDLVSRCTVKIEYGAKVGTGFFVAPGRLLTAHHVIDVASSEIHIFLRGAKVATNVKTLTSNTAFRPDLALLLLSFTDHPCCLLADDYPDFDETLWTWGFTKDYPKGDSASFTCEGVSNHTLDGYLIKTKSGQAYPGMSGAPLIRLQTGLVCAVMVTERMSAATGGSRAIPIQTVYAQWPELKTLQGTLGPSARLWTEFSRGIKSPDHQGDKALASTENMGFTPPSFLFQTGRKQTLSDISERCSEHPIVAIEGLPGAGKSFAVSAFTSAPNHSYKNFYWYTAQGGESFEELLLQLSSVFHLSGTIDKQSKGLISQLHQLHTALVIDDFHVVNPASYSPLIDAASRAGGPASVIVISRDYVDAGRNWPVIGHLEIGGFNLDELRACLNVRGITMSKEIARILHLKTDGLPLAVSLFATLVDQFNEDPLHLLSGEIERDSRLKNWFDELQRRMTNEESSLLATLSVYGAPFNRDLVRFVCSQLGIDTADEVLETLKRRYLIQRSTLYRWNVHHLIAAFSSTHVTIAIKNNLFIKFAEHALRGINIGRDSTISDQNAVWVIRAVRFYQRAGKYRDAGRLLERLSSTVKARGLYNLFIPPAESQVEGEHDNTGWIKYHLAHCYQIMGDTKRAFELTTKMLASNVGESKHWFLATRRLHAELLTELGDYDAALRILYDALDRQLDINPSSTTYDHARSIEILILTKLRKYGEAFALAQALLANNVKRNRRRGVAVAKMRLGLIKFEQGDIGGAIEYFDSTVDDFHQSGDVRGEAWALTHLGRALLRLRQVEKGSDVFSKGMDLTEQIGGYSEAYRELLSSVLSLSPTEKCADIVRQEIQRLNERADMLRRTVF